MKFKRTIASLLATVFSLTLMGSNVPRTFAEENPKVVAEISNSKSKEEIEKSEEKISEKSELTELKEKIKQLEEKLNENEKGWSFKKGISAIKRNFKAILSIGIIIAISAVVNDTYKPRAEDNESSQEDDIAIGNGKSLLENIKHKKFEYLSNALNSMITCAAYRFAFA